MCVLVCVWLHFIFLCSGSFFYKEEDKDSSPLLSEKQHSQVWVNQIREHCIVLCAHVEIFLVCSQHHKAHRLSICACGSFSAIVFGMHFGLHTHTHNQSCTVRGKCSAAFIHPSMGMVFCNGAMGYMHSEPGPDHHLLMCVSIGMSQVHWVHTAPTLFPRLSRCLAPVAVGVRRKRTGRDAIRWKKPLRTVS